MENQDIFDQLTENRQNYLMQHLNNATAGCENTNVVGGEVENVSVGGEILGVKYDEHAVGDDDELKYVKEVQQSEKQQQQQPLKNYSMGDGDYDSYEYVGKETAKGSHDFGNDVGAFVFGGDHLLQHQEHQDMFNLGNGHNGNEIHENDEIAANTDFSSHASAGFEDRNPFNTEIEGFRTEGDFSFTSNNTESVEDFVPQVDVKIEPKSEQQEAQELGDEEEPSSVATNTTNGTSSLSENVPQPATAPASAFDDLMDTLENKENDDPLTPQRPDALNIDQAQSILNPDAKEFIPSFGSNPSSPTSPFATGMQSSDLGEPMETQMYFGQQPSALPRHLLGDDDDFVAQSPRKGRGDNNMDSVPLPKELAEFEKEADKRPHELETKDESLLQNRDGVMTPDQQVQQLPLDDVINEQENHDISSPKDITDFQPSSIMDHGPETSVDLDLDIDLQPDAVLASLQQEDDVMKRSMYVASDEAAIEDVLNSVQPIPTEIDSVNNSFIEESATESAAAHLANDKELLQVEEKEHVSHSPSTEEIQMNLQNNLNSSNKDISQLPIDMDHEHDNVDDMQESLYEPQDQSHEIAEEQHNYNQETQEQHINMQETLEQHINTQETLEQHNEESFLADITNPLIATDKSILNNSVEPQQQQQPEHQEEIHESFETLNSLANTDMSSAIGFDAVNIDLNENSQEQHALSDVLTPSSTTDEKHLFEDTKEKIAEQQLFSENHKEAQLFSMSGLEQQMSEMLLNNDGHLSQAEEVVTAPPADTTAIDNESERYVISPDVAALTDEDHSEQQKMIVDESFNEFEQKPIQEQEPEQQQREEHEQHEAHEEPEPVQELIECPMHKQDLENEMVAIEEPLFEAKQSAPLFNTEETEIVIDPSQEVVEMCMVPETAPCVLLEPPQSPVMEAETPIVETVADDHKPMVEFNEEPKPEVEVMTENISAAEEVKEDSSLVDTAAVATATAALAATAAVVAVEAAKGDSSSTKKSEVAKKPLVKTAATTTTAAKPKVGATTTAAKKPLESAKKPIGLAAKPRLAPAKPASSMAGAEKKHMTKATTTTTTTRKPLGVGSASSAAPKPAAKPPTTTSTTRTTARPTTAPRATTTTTTTRKPIASTTTNGPAARPRPATAPAKPTTLGLPATNGAAKTKVTSPRAMLSTQLRKAAPPATPRSPVKTSSTNGVTKTTATSTLASRTKTTTGSASVSTTHGTTGHGTTTKTFTARPAPKFTTSSSSSTTTTTTTRRLTVGGATAAASTTTTTMTKTSGAPLRKSSPSKPLAGRTPTRPATTAGGLKSKTPITKKESPPEQKPAPIRKPVDKTIIPNGGDAAAAANIAKELNGNGEQQPLNGSGGGGGGAGDMLQAVQHNGDSIIPNQTDVHQQSFLQPRDEEIPMDLINA